jgi:hypothetical protein
VIDPRTHIETERIMTDNNTTTMTNGTSSSSSIPDSDWSKDRLMGKTVSFKGISKEGEAISPSAAATTTTRHTTTASKEKMDPMLWGRPGHLTDAEAETFVSVFIIVIQIHDD